MAGFDRAAIPPASSCRCPTTSRALEQPLTGLKIGLLKEFFDKGLDPENEQRMRAALEVLREARARRSRR